MGPRKLWPDPDIDTFLFERDLQQQGYELIAGLDEVGRGPLAGPVVAACVVLPVACDYRIFRDSKKLCQLRASASLTNWPGWMRQLGSV